MKLSMNSLIASVFVFYSELINTIDTFSTVFDTQDTIKKGSLRLPENTTSYVFISASGCATAF